MNFRHFTLLILFPLVTSAQSIYDAGDWTSYKDFRYALAVDAGSHEVFVATTGGILEYKVFRKKWYDPMVIGYGFSESIPITDPVLLLLDEQTGFLWVATKSELLLYDVNADRWRRVERDLWGMNDRVVNIGIGGNDIYLETVPANLFSSFFPAGSPIPNDHWLGYVTRYKGTRQFGGFQRDLDPQIPDDLRWRGLRSHVPLAETPPPAGFPSVLLQDGWMWRMDGVLTDSYVRPFPITDWIQDGFGNLWTTFWGAGVMIVDPRMHSAEFHSTGPTGNDIRAITRMGDDYWMGGLNNDERQGITRASRSLDSWKFYERRDNSRIRSTDVFDLTPFDGDIWAATDEGLLAFHKKEWKLRTVSDGLFADQIRALAATDSELWIGTVRGLCVMTLPGREIWRIENSGIELAAITDLAVCGDTVYVGTENGIFRGSVQDRRFQFWPMPGGLLNAPVAEFSIIGPEVWIVTAEGVVRYDQGSGESKAWRADIWLAGGEPSCILATESNSWVGTRGSGFWRYNRTKNEWLQYTTADGLLDNRIQVIRRDGDDLLIGTPSGLTRFYWNVPNRAK